MTATVIRLVTHVELNEARTTPEQLDVSARLEAELSDGRALVLLDDRGWAESALGGGDIRAHLTAESLAEDARTVVGLVAVRLVGAHEQAATAYWTVLAERLASRGVRADPTGLASLPHDVVLGARLRAWAGL